MAGRSDNDKLTLIQQPGPNKGLRLIILPSRSLNSLCQYSLCLTSTLYNSGPEIKWRESEHVAAFPPRDGGDSMRRAGALHARGRAALFVRPLRDGRYAPGYGNYTAGFTIIRPVMEWLALTALSGWQYCPASR
ncbi:hypothetical protein J6590_042068 [Homalodisca vitripennis]|nr:hypothetical protein J6590_042068 [Homalodisca vitripennis]